MTKKKTLVKRALANPHLYTPAELTFFQRWLDERKRKKKEKKLKKEQENGKQD